MRGQTINASELGILPHHPPDHAIAVHFNLGTKPGEGGALPLRFEEMSEQLESSIYERA